MKSVAKTIWKQWKFKKVWVWSLSPLKWINISLCLPAGLLAGQADRQLSGDSSPHSCLFTCQSNFYQVTCGQMNVDLPFALNRHLTVCVCLQILLILTHLTLHINQTLTRHEKGWKISKKKKKFIFLSTGTSWMNTSFHLTVLYYCSACRNCNTLCSI